MIVRRLGTGDLDAFRNLRLLALRTDPEAYESDHDDWAAMPDDVWRGYLRHEIIFAGFDGNRPVALAGPVANTRARIRHRAVLAMVYVLPDCRGQGVAQALLGEVVTFAEALGLGQIVLSVWGDNRRALSFYEQAGFETYGRLPSGLRRAGGFADDVCMVRQLGSGGNPA